MTRDLPPRDGAGALLDGPGAPLVRPNRRLQESPPP